MSVLDVVSYKCVAFVTDDLPPPPPKPSDYNDFPPPPADLPPPPSPVSSSYSELRRATHHYPPDYGTYTPYSQVLYLYNNLFGPLNLHTFYILLKSFNVHYTVKSTLHYSSLHLLGPLLNIVQVSQLVFLSVM